MHYTIEFLAEPTEENSVCFSMDAESLEAAAIIGLSQKNWAWVSHGAHGFQIRNNGKIVALEDYSFPSQRPN
jgi:hypothetical protein